MKTTEFMELNAQELEDVNGGWLRFVGGAIIGGIIYDAWKEGIRRLGNGEFGDIAPASKR